ncbi:MAG: molybdopterin-dependent oxidoreductase [Anaerolineales bacterium]|nr:molybdopterin-dependent oxidoreductase [Anaerolineales bacterium]
MTEKLSRRDFLKLTAAGAGATAVLTGCGPASRYVVRSPYAEMPEYTYNGQSTFYATTCRECPAGCGIVVRTHQGRALKIEGNPSHPVNLGKTCSRGQAALQGLYNPDRVEAPQALAAGDRQEIDWDRAIRVVREALIGNRPEEIAFLLGPSPDHLYDLVSEIMRSLGGPAPLCYGTQALFEARATLVQATAQVLNRTALPFCDLGGSDVAFSFGANFLETWLSPLAYGRGFARMRRGQVGRRGFLVQFEPRLSQTGAAADEWIAVAPGTEGLVALALGRLVAEARGGLVPAAYREVDVATAAEASGVPEGTLTRLAGIFANAEHPLAVPGGAALGHVNGLEAARAVLTLNALAGNLGQPGGVFLTPVPNVHPDSRRGPDTLVEINALIGRMRSGQVKALFVHGINPAFELPAALGFTAALENVPQIISFASFPDETALLADYIFPDHTPLESWGYQKVRTGSDRAALSGAQPVVVPFHNTRATVDVLLAAIQAAGGDLAAGVPYSDEVDFLQQSLLTLVQEAGNIAAPEIRTFMTQFQQYGGWWAAEAGLDAPSTPAPLERPLRLIEPEFAGEGEFHLHVYPSPILGDGAGANRPWLQETPDPMTTVMWNTWVEINPETADELGLEDNDVVRVASDFGAIEAPVYRYPAIRRDTIAIPFGQGHTALGRYADGRGANPVALLGLKLTGAGDLAFAATRVRLEKTGRTSILARLESRIGVYGEGLE